MSQNSISSRLVVPSSEEKSSAQQTVETPDDVYTKILKLDDLRKRGLITDEEFDAEKKKLLESE